MPNRIILTFAISLAFLAGCQAPPAVDPFAPQIVTAPIVKRCVIGRSLQNRPLEYLTLGTGTDTIFILAAIHGNEPAGVTLVNRLTEYLMLHRYILTGRKVILMPIANPDGLAAAKRLNANGIDLNRNFDTTNRINNPRFGKTPLSESEARAINHIIEMHTPDRIVSIHQPLACIDYDGPAHPLAEHIARCTLLPIRKLGARPGSLGSYAGITLNIPIITLELTAADSDLTKNELWQKYAPAILAAITYPQRIM